MLVTLSMFFSVLYLGTNDSILQIQESKRL